MPVLRDNHAGRSGMTAIAMYLGDLRGQGDRLVAAARAEADRILADARAERERLVATARDEGHAAGFAQGLAQGVEEGRRQGHAQALSQASPRLTAIAAAWEQALQRHAQSHDRLLDDARGELLDLALQIARRVVRRAVDTDPAAVLPQVHAVLAQMGRATRAVIHVHPDDEALVREALPGVVAALGSAPAHDLRADPSVEPGSCRLTTPAGGHIDASISIQLDRIAQAIVPDRGAP
jgi:flagellar assembly protein FliH